MVRSLRRAPTGDAPRGWVLPRALVVLLGGAALVLVVAGMRAASTLLGPVFLALVLAVAVQPMQDWARRRGLPRPLGAAAAILTIYLLLVGLVASVVVSVTQLVDVLPRYQDRADQLLADARAFLARFGVDDARIQQELSGVDLDRVVSVVQAGVEGLLGVASALTLVLVLVLFVVYDGMCIRERLAEVGRERPDIAHALRSFAAGTRRYLVVTTVFGLVVAVLDGVALWWLGIPLPLLWALLSFITNYIPNIGFVLGLVPPALLALLEGGWVLMVWVVAVYSVFNVVIQSVIQPKFEGDTAGVTVTVAFLSLVFWSWVLGALGALLAIPLTMLFKAVLLDIDPSTRWVRALVEAAPATGPPPPAPRTPPPPPPR